MTALAIFVWVALIAVCAFLLLLDWIDTQAEVHARRSLAVDEWLDEASEEINLDAVNEGRRSLLLPTVVDSAELAALDTTADLPDDMRSA